MPRPWEMTEEQVREERERLRERLRAADRQDSWLFAWQLARAQAPPDATEHPDGDAAATSDEGDDPSP